MYKLKCLCLALLSASLLFGSTLAGRADTAPLSSDDKEFIKAAVQGGLFEIQTGNYAATNGKNGFVQDLGKKLASDHAALNQKLVDFANKSGYDVPTDLSLETKGKIEFLTLHSTNSFDMSYLKDIKAAHKSDIKAFQDEAATTSNSDLRNLVNDALPTLKSHLKMAMSDSKRLASQ